MPTSSPDSLKTCSMRRTRTAWPHRVRDQHHAVGFYDRTRTIDQPRSIPGPTAGYGVSEGLREALGSLLRDQVRKDSGVSFQIGNVQPRPMTSGRLSIWLSPRDLAQLVSLAIDRPGIRFEIVLRGFWEPPQLVRQRQRRAPGLQAAKDDSEGWAEGSSEQDDTGSRSAAPKNTGRPLSCSPRTAATDRARRWWRRGRRSGRKRDEPPERFRSTARAFPGRCSSPARAAASAAGAVAPRALGRSSLRFDLSEDKRRPRLLIEEKELAKIGGMTGDISDSAL